MFATFLALILVLFGVQVAMAQSDDTEQKNARVSTSYEEWTVSEQERMGVSSLMLHYDANQFFSIGFGTWMAVRGQRGGFITLGVDGAFRLPLLHGFSSETGFFLGAGGGRDGIRLAGGGLMLRPHTRLTWNMSKWLELSAGASYVDFPFDGIISSAQPFVKVSAPMNLPVNAHRKTGRVGKLEDTSIGTVLRFLKPTSESRTTAGQRQEPITLLGIELRSYLNPSLFAKVETQGAMGGNNNGYMQILAGFGYQFRITHNVSLSSDLSLGGAGGGAVETGGGVLLNAGIGLQANISRNFFIGLAATYFDAPEGTFSGPGYTVKTGYRTGGSMTARNYSPYRIRARFVNDTYVRAAENWRGSNEDERIDNMGLQFDVFVNSVLYISGQGIAAYQGKAGAYMIGLLGSGIRYPANSLLFINAEIMVGAAGGGGLKTGSGLVWQANGGPGLQLSPDFSLMTTIGRLESFNGPLKANVLSLSFGWHFGI